MNQFNPNSVKDQFGLQMAGYLVHSYKPRSLHLCTRDPEVAIAAILNLSWAGDGLTVENEEIQEIVASALGIRLNVGFQRETDVVLFPFSRRQYPEPLKARHMVMIDQNALSYKSLLYPGQIQDQVISQVHWFQKSYRIEQRVGMFGPMFLLNWAMSVAAGTRFAPLHFFFDQRAMDHLYTTSAAWWTGFIVLLSGTYRN